MSLIVDNIRGKAAPTEALLPAATGSTRADSVFDSLRTAIVQGELAPGSKINEPQLSKLYGISRGPLREAIRRLEGCKLVEIKANVGARVIELDIQKAIEIYEIREALEGLACGLAAERASSADCVQLRALLTRHEAQIESEDGKRYYQKEGDLDFHYLIVSLSGNTRLFNLLCDELYHRIVDAIEERDAMLAELLMRRHIASAKATLLAQLDHDSELNPIGVGS